MASRSFRIGRAYTGLGLFATKPIKRKTQITTYRGWRLTYDEATKRETRGARYLFDLNKRWTIDGSPRWNVARYINHSCRPNATPVSRNGGIAIDALRRIEPDEEITYHYGKDYHWFFVQDGGCKCAYCRAKVVRRRRKQRKARAVAKARTRARAKTKARAKTRAKARTKTRSKARKLA
ncbi:MAG TPA: SET domain-containing protein [Xanthobacteraceae bacterium]|jgi:hypothetical protein|nr:SET domain-containing protein [Xanthobacteraceae bacterium]